MLRNYMLTDDDCLRACIASLLEVSCAEVPHFHADHSASDVEVTEAINRFLKGWGLRKIGFGWHAALTDRDTLLRYVAMNNPGINYMLFGETLDRTPHVVICRDDAIYHDPAPWQPGVHYPHLEVWTVVMLVPEILCYE